MTAKKPGRLGVRAHNNLKLCELLARHLADCAECDSTWNGSYCETGMHLRMMLGRTDTGGPRYDKLGFPVDPNIDSESHSIFTGKKVAQTAQTNQLHNSPAFSTGTKTRSAINTTEKQG